jgi:hypothetical protein
MSKSHPIHAAPRDSSRHGTPSAPGVPPSRPAWGPIDFEGDDTSLTQDHLALLKWGPPER